MSELLGKNWRFLEDYTKQDNLERRRREKDTPYIVSLFRLTQMRTSNDVLNDSQLTAGVLKVCCLKTTSQDGSAGKVHEIFMIEYNS